MKAGAAVVIACTALAVPPALRAEDEFTLYELLAPDSHRFAITYDVTTAVEGARFFFNPIRPGSVSTDERVVERARGRELKWEVVKGREAKATGLVRPATPDDALFIKVSLPEPVPKGGATRLRILKTYLDAKSYYAEGDTIVFDRGLSIRRNAVVLPAGYELTGCATPGVVSTEPDGRVKVSFVNDRDDSMPVRIVGRKLAERRDPLPNARAGGLGGATTAPPGSMMEVREVRPLALAAALALGAAAQAQFHRAEQDREITYWLQEPETHRFRISHDFTVTRAGQASVHSFVRKGSTVEESRIVDLDTGQELKTHNVSGREVNALGYYPEPTADDTVVVQGDLPRPLAAGESVRVRVTETYADAERYGVKDGALVWDRTLGRPLNTVLLPAGWMLRSLSVPAVVSLDAEGRVACRFINPRNDELHVVLTAVRRP